MHCLGSSLAWDARSVTVMHDTTRYLELYQGAISVFGGVMHATVSAVARSPSPLLSQHRGTEGRASAIRGESAALSAAVCPFISFCRWLGALYCEPWRRPS
jgi:hypothetical protein